MNEVLAVSKASRENVSPTVNRLLDQSVKPDLPKNDLNDIVR